MVKLSLCTQAPTHSCFLLWRVLLQPAVNPICIQKRQQGPLFIGLPLLKRTVYWLQKGVFYFKLINSCFSPKLYPRDWFLSFTPLLKVVLQTPSKSFSVFQKCVQAKTLFSERVLATTEWKDNFQTLSR